MSDDRQEERMINDVILHSGQMPTAEHMRPQLKQADNDEQLVQWWLHGKSKHTQRYYRADVERFFTFTAKSLNRVILRDLQSFADSIDQQDLTDGSKRRILSSVKSLISFAHRLGYL